MKPTLGNHPTPTTSVVDSPTAVPQPLRLATASRRRALPTASPLLRASATVSTWMLAALATEVVAPGVELASGPPAALIFKVAAIAAAAGLLGLGPLRRAGCEPSPWTGLAWLALTVVVEMAAVHELGPAWSELLGDPAVPWMRNVLMLSWLGMPAVFGRHEWW